MSSKPAQPSKNPRRSPEPQDRQRDPVRTRKLILDAAIAEFSAHGYAGARIATIATRAGVNQQLISYYFGGKKGLYQALEDNWRQRESDLIPTGTPLTEQIRRYALEALNNPDGVRLFARSGLEYSGPETNADPMPRSDQLQDSVDELQALQEAGQLPAELDPTCLTIMLMAAAMAPTTLPHVIEGLCQTDPRSSEFLNHYADQVAKLTELLSKPS